MEHQQCPKCGYTQNMKRVIILASGKKAHQLRCTHCGNIFYSYPQQKEDLVTPSKNTSPKKEFNRFSEIDIVLVGDNK
jgi:uncharacterized Zn finger protein